MAGASSLHSGRRPSEFRYSDRQLWRRLGSTVHLLCDRFIRRLCWRFKRRTSTTPAGFPSSDHVFVVMLENQDFSQVFPAEDATDCSSSGMPYLCTLAEANGMASHFYSNAHGSLLAYLFNTSGADWKGKPYDCTGTACASAGVIKGDNIVRALNKTHKTWRGYFEGMPYCGYMGASSGNYTLTITPSSGTPMSPTQRAKQDNMCPFTQLATDISTNALPNFGYIIPNEADDAEGTGSQSASALLSKADNWIKTNIGPGPGTLLSSAPFQPGGDGILIVTFDEARVKGKSGDKSSDDACSPTQVFGLWRTCRVRNDWPQRNRGLDCERHLSFPGYAPHHPSPFGNLRTT